jgi:uncharacterized membrane protein
MNPKIFHSQIDRDRLIAALAGAEQKTAGRIYVYVSHRPITDALAAARQRFAKLGLSRLHEDRASVLIYLAPRTHKFAIIGDTAIHERCGEDYWKRLAEKFSQDLKFGELTAALLNAIASLKATLEEHFPLKPSHRAGA